MSVSSFNCGISFETDGNSLLIVDALKNKANKVCVSLVHAENHSEARKTLARFALL